PACRRHRQGGRPDACPVQSRRVLRAVRLLAEQQRAVGGRSGFRGAGPAGAGGIGGFGGFGGEPQRAERVGERVDRSARRPGGVDDQTGVDRRPQRVPRHGRPGPRRRAVYVGHGKSPPSYSMSMLVASPPAPEASTSALSPPVARPPASTGSPGSAAYGVRVLALGAIRP